MDGSHGGRRRGTGRGLPAAALLLAADAAAMEGYLTVPVPDMYPWALLLEMLAFLAAGAALAFITGMPRAPLCVIGILSGFVGTADRYLYIFKGMPLRLADFGSVRTAVAVASGYDFTPDGRMLAMWLVSAALSVSPFVLSRTLRGLGDMIRDLGRARRLAGAVLSCAVLAGTLAGMRYGYMRLARLAAEGEPGDGRFNVIDPAGTRCAIGTLCDWAGEIAMGRPREPDGYGSWDPPADGFDPDVLDIAALPDVVVVMDEAFSDPDDFGGSWATSPYMPFLDSFGGMPNAARGSLDVSVIAGNTANTEFEVLTGASLACYPRYSVPYSGMVERDVPSLARYFSAMGYETWAVHPHYGSNWNRAEVYGKMGFDKSLFMGSSCGGVELPDRSDTYDPDLNTEDFLSDEDLFDIIHRDILGKRSEDGVPRFVFVVTVYNHGGYYRPFDGLEFDVRIDPDVASSLDDPVDELAMVKYLSLLKKSDAALGSLASALSDRKAGTGFDSLVAFFGDHQPDYTAHRAFEAAGGLGPDGLTAEQSADFYKVPYGLWSTRDLPEGFDLGRKGAIYVGCDLFRAIGAGVPDWYGFLSGMSERVPVLSAVRTESDGSDEASDYIAEYLRLVRYRMSDPGGWSAPG